MLSFISKILSQHVVLLVATRISLCFALSKCCIHSHSGLSTLLHIGLSQHVLLLVATRISPCFALSKCCIHSHSGLSTLLHIGLSQHAFLRAPHSRNAAYIRIPGYRCFSTLVCRNTHFSVLRTLEMLHTFAFRAIDASPHRSCRNTSCFLSQHAFLRASHSRNAAYIRIPGYRPTCSCMFVLLIARALCLQAVTCPAIAELLRQVVPGGCVSSILTHAEVQMVAGGTSGGAHCGYRLSSGHNIVLGYI